MCSHIGWMGLGLLLATQCAAAQTQVYKCETDHGTVYSGQPCAGSEVQVLHLQPPPTPDPAEVRRRAGMRDAMAARHRQRELARQEALCINNRAEATRRGTQRRINEYQRQINQLQRRLAYANNNLAGATWENGIREQISGLQAAIGNEKNILAKTELNARTICARQRAQAQPRLEP